MDWFPLALATAVSLATADALTKRFFADYSGPELVALRMGATGALLLPLALLNPLPAVPPVFWAWMALLVPMELGAMLLYLLAIRDSPLHLTLPYLAFTPVFNVVTAYLTLGEQVSAAGLGGVALVVLGAYGLNLRHAFNGGGWLAPLRAIGRERGSRRMLAVAAIYSLTSVFSKAAMEHATPQTFGPFYFALVGASAVILVGLWRPRALRVFTRRPARYLVVGAFMAVMVVTHFLALARVEVAYFIAVKRISLLFGILYGYLLFAERGLLRHLAAGGLMVAGVALIVVAG